MALQNFDEAGSHEDDDDLEEDEEYERRNSVNLRSQGNLLARVDRRTELDLSGRNLSFSTGLASTYVALTTLNLSNNSIARLESIPTSLIVLDASHNLIREISGLENFFSLTSLNLAYNSLTRIRGLDHCTSLTELSLQNNEIKVVSDLECNMDLERLDVSNNMISTVEALRTLSLNSKLAWMSLRGNPCAQNPQYRHRLTGMLPQLLILDNVRMPKNNHRPSSPARPLKTMEERKRDGALAASKGPMRAFSQTPLRPQDEHAGIRDASTRSMMQDGQDGALSPWTSAGPGR